MPRLILKARRHDIRKRAAFHDCSVAKLPVVASQAAVLNTPLRRLGTGSASSFTGPFLPLYYVGPDFRWGLFLRGPCGSRFEWSNGTQPKSTRRALIFYRYAFGELPGNLTIRR